MTLLFLNPYISSPTIPAWKSIFRCYTSHGFFLHSLSFFIQILALGLGKLSHLRSLVLHKNIFSSTFLKRLEDLWQLELDLCSITPFRLVFLGVSHTGSKRVSDIPIPTSIGKSHEQDFERRSSSVHEDRGYFDSVFKGERVSQRTTDSSGNLILVESPRLQGEAAIEVTFEVDAWQYPKY